LCPCWEQKTLPTSAIQDHALRAASRTRAMHDATKFGVPRTG
jgi:hypothetical protein